MVDLNPASWPPFRITRTGTAHAFSLLPPYPPLTPAKECVALGRERMWEERRQPKEARLGAHTGLSPASQVAQTTWWPAPGSRLACQCLRYQRRVSREGREANLPRSRELDSHSWLCRLGRGSLLPEAWKNGCLKHWPMEPPGAWSQRESQQRHINNDGGGGSKCRRMQALALSPTCPSHPNKPWRQDTTSHFTKEVA